MTTAGLAVDPRRFAGVGRLWGEAAAARFAAAEVTVVGIGGVGSWAVEALARSGVGALRLIDLDHVSESNTNRQLHALGDAYGRAKVDAMAERVRQINPRVAVRCIEDFVDADNAAALLADAPLVLDCIDQVRAKAALIAAVRAAGHTVITCGAAGGRLDPTRIGTDDLARIAGDPLLARVRHRLRHEHGFPPEDGGRRPRFGVLAVGSSEPVRRPQPACATGDAAAGDERPDAAAAVAGGGRPGLPAAPLACAGYGSSVAVTATMGLVAAARALDALAREAAGAA